MKRHVNRFFALALPAVFGIAIGLGWSQATREHSAQAEGPGCAAAKCEKAQRFGSLIGLRPEKKDYYIELHAATWPNVLDQIRESNIRNYSIYMAEMEGKLYLFSYFEYVGTDFEADMQKMAKDPETQRWWKETDPCQTRLPGTPEGQQWTKITEVFHTD